ncbi:TPA: WGR domain-containing protein [Clostridioides difficile]|nr:WGR domain-containing protein [Clostridioides difficile]
MCKNDLVSIKIPDWRKKEDLFYQGRVQLLSHKKLYRVMGKKKQYYLIELHTNHKKEYRIAYFDIQEGKRGIVKIKRCNSLTEAINCFELCVKEKKDKGYCRV